MAKVNAAIFEGRKHQIIKRLKEVDKAFELKNDIEVKLLCEVDLYPKTGNFSILVIDIDPIYTLGKIAQSRQKILEDLKKRGLLDKNKSQTLPLVPLKIGLITAHTSAAFHDFTNELEQSNYGFKVLAPNCHMQGNNVEKDILQALSSFNRLPQGALDAVVITRGGGSTADLSYFDNKKIAEAIALSRLPVITALGHQINITISDMVSHTVCKTPTKAAQFLTEKVRGFLENLDYLAKEIVDSSVTFLGDKSKDLKNLSLKLESETTRYFRLQREELLSKKHKVLSALERMLESAKEYLKHAKQKLNILDPKNVLKRGYSLTYKGSRILKSINAVELNDQITTILSDGKIISEARKKEKTDD
jgi:exodeoxyribonuclease VII large subunit